MNKLNQLKKTLIVVDMVNGFLKEGNMANPYAQHILLEVKGLVESFLENGDDVLSIQEAHAKDSKEFTYFLEHCVIGTGEEELVQELQTYQKQMKVIRKNSTCGYLTKDFQDYLVKNQNKISEYVVVGVCSDICVLNFALPLHNHLCQYNLLGNVTVPLDAIETYDLPGHNRNEYNDIAKKVLLLNGVKVVDHYQRERRGK